MNTSILIAADNAVTPEERSAFLSHYPSLQGAHVADILDMLNDSDAYLDVVEPMYELHGSEVPEPGLLGTATRLCVGIRGCEDGVTWEVVKELVDRIRARLG